MFKKITTLILSIFTLIVSWSLCSVSLFKDYQGQREVYLRENSSNCNIHNFEKDNTAYFTMRYGEACELKDVRQSPNEILNNFNAYLLFVENTEVGVSYYAYSPKIPYSIKINGYKVNIQIFAGEKSLKIASPIIFGSY